MSTPTDLAVAVAGRLQTITTITTYPDGVVPARPAADANGRVYPYAVLYAGAGARPDEAVAVDAAPGPELTWTCQVTVAAGTTGWCLGAAALVRGALDRARILPGVLLTETPTGQVVQPDPDTTPTRWYVPLLFTCLTA